MKNTIEITANTNIATESSDFFKRLSVLTYGVMAYGIGCIGLFWLLLGAGGVVPVGLSEWKADSIATSLLVNAGLIVLFGVQHSIMARRGFKQWLTKIIPAATERATYMLASGVVTIIVVYFWQTLPGTVWHIENSVAQIVLWSLYAIGIAYLLLATFITNHFELMGLRQVYLFFRNKPYSALPFTNKFMYRYSRHPMMLGMLIIFWATPVMSVTHLVLAVLFTLYIAVGIYFEERDLIRDFGETYRKYKKDIATFIPGMY